jgi:aspartyl-tRNA synthetase
LNSRKRDGERKRGERERRRRTVENSLEIFKKNLFEKHRQGDFGRVFEITPVFRAEKSFTHRHLTEFTGLDFEMCINEHYEEVLEVIDKLFVSMFDGLNERCSAEIEVVRKQFPVPPLRYLRKTLILTFEEGIEMLKKGGYPDIDPLADLNTEVERALGKMVAEKFGTDFFILKRYPSAVRPFYTMPDPVDPDYSNSYDVFIRGEEIISGAQRVHDAELLRAQAEKCGIEVESIRDYINSFKWGSFPHGGAGVGLERVVMLFLGLDNIRKTSLFPRDPKRLTP